MTRPRPDALLLVIAIAGGFLAFSTPRPGSAPTDRVDVSPVSSAPGQSGAPTTAARRSRATAGPSAQPSRLGAPFMPAAVHGGSAAGTPASAIYAGSKRAGVASWYCWPGRSKCTVRWPWSGPYAAAGPALRVGHWRGRLVTVCHLTRCVRLRLVDWCACPGRLVDLYGSVFGRLAPLSRGLIRVEVSW